MDKTTDRKLIAIDLDGTLLNREKNISARNKRMLLQAQAMGHHVVIATGRAPRSSYPYYDELELRTPMVNFNGALVHNVHDAAFGQHHFPVERETALAVIETSERFGISNVMVEYKDDFYMDKHDPELIRFIGGDGKQPLGIGTLHEVLAEIHPTSVLIQPHAETAQQLRQFLAEHHSEMIEHRLWGVPWNVIEVVKAGVNKAKGLELVAQSLGVARENIIAFGDEDNDLEMIQFAGVGVAMGNANPQLKAVANRIADTNENDGIALMLEKLL